MTRVFKLSALLALLTIVTACKKNDQKFIVGKYEGNYYRFIIHQSKPGVGDKPVSVEFLSGDTYTSEGTANRMPAGGSGTYQVGKGGMINFTDKNVWTTDFDSNTILNGQFKYQVKADSLILTRYFPPCPNCDYIAAVYQYRLKRVK